MNVGCYLQRIGFQGASTCPSLETLKHLHRSHLFSVPFESLSIHCKEPIRLELPRLYEKIVQNHRGGFCYELNGLFQWLLQALGFHTKILAARVCNRFTQCYGPPLDHLIILVDLDGQQFLCDVGFGEGFLEPLELKPEVEQAQKGGIFWLSLEEVTWVLECRKIAGERERFLYKFTLEEKQLEDFSDMCLYHQTSPCSIFTCKSFCSLHKADGGRVTYMGQRLIFTTGKDRTETVLQDSEIPTVLFDQFGIKMKSFEPKDEQILPPPQQD
uniref:arylamine N-acetyltransferase n=1 Tax=Micrurus spixii TaxID=129469 RepID=A0A2D4MK10_9SAUR